MLQFPQPLCFVGSKKMLLSFLLLNGALHLKSVSSGIGVEGEIKIWSNCFTLLCFVSFRFAAAVLLTSVDYFEITS